jgi:hypothetical protein
LIFETEFSRKVAGDGFRVARKLTVTIYLFIFFYIRKVTGSLTLNSRVFFFFVCRWWPEAMDGGRWQRLGMGGIGSCWGGG